MPPQAGGASQKCSPPITSRFPWTEVFASVLARFWVNSWPLVAKNPESNQNRRTRTNLGGDVPRTSYAPPKFADDGRRSTNAIHSNHRGDVPRTSYSNPTVRNEKKHSFLTRMLEVKRNILIRRKNNIFFCDFDLFPTGYRRGRRGGGWGGLDGVA